MAKIAADAGAVPVAGGLVGDAEEDLREGVAARGNSTFEALEDPRYRILFLGSLFSFLAMQMQMIARGWLAFQLTGSNAGLGAVFLGFGLPMLLATPFGGVAADRLPKRRVLLVCQFFLTANAAIIATAILGGFIEYWMLIAASAVQGLGFSFLGPARMAFTGELVGHRLLPNAVVLQQMSMNGSRVLGSPSVAGALVAVAWFGAGGVYVLVALFLRPHLRHHLLPAAWRPEPQPPPAQPRRPRCSTASPTFASARSCWCCCSPPFVVVMLGFPYLAFLPTVAADIFDAGSSGYGVMMTVSAVGAVAASLWIASRAGGAGAWRLQAVGGITFGVALFVLGLAPTYAMALVAIMVVGGAASAFQSLNNSLVLTLSDNEYHGRIQSLMMLSFSGFGMAALPLGVVADAIGLRTTLMGMGLISVAMLAVAVAWRARITAAEDARLADAATSALAAPPRART